MSKKLVSDLLVDYLERRGVTKLFGLCGHTVIGMLDALSRSKKIEYIGTRHEAIASTASLCAKPATGSRGDRRRATWVPA